MKRINKNPIVLLVTNTDVLRKRQVIRRVLNTPPHVLKEAMQLSLTVKNCFFEVLNDKVFAKEEKLIAHIKAALEA